MHVLQDRFEDSGTDMKVKSIHLQKCGRLDHENFQRRQKGRYTGDSVGIT